MKRPALLALLLTGCVTPKPPAPPAPPASEAAGRLRQAVEELETISRRINVATEDLKKEGR